MTKTQDVQVEADGLERRTIPAGEAEIRLHEEGDGPPVLEGYAALYDSRSVPMKRQDGRTFREVIREGAFEAALEDGARDVIAAYNHDPDSTFARQSNGTLELTTDERGLRYRARLNPEDPDAKRVYTKVGDGNVRGSSFTFRVPEDGQEWRMEDGGLIREITEFSFLGDVSAVVRPAYMETVVDARSIERAEELMEERVSSENGAPGTRAVRDTVRRELEFEGTETADEQAWGGVDLTFDAFIDGYFRHNPDAERPDEGVDSVDDAPQAALSWMAAKSFLGNATAQTFREVVFLPAVNPETNQLNEAGLDAAASRAGQIAGEAISQELADAVIEAAAALSEEHFGEEEGQRFRLSRGERAVAEYERRTISVGGYIVSRTEERQTDEDIRDLVLSALREEFGGEDTHVWIQATFMEEDQVVYRLDADEGEHGLFRVSFEVGEDGSVTLGDPEPVRRVTTFEPLDEGGGGEGAPGGEENDTERMRRIQRQKEAEAGVA